MAKPVLCDTCQGLRCRCCGVLQDWSDSWSPVACVALCSPLSTSPSSSLLLPPPPPPSSHTLPPPPHHLLSLSRSSINLLTIQSYDTPPTPLDRRAHTALCRRAPPHLTALTLLPTSTPSTAASLTHLHHDNSHRLYPLLLSVLVLFIPPSNAPCRVVPLSPHPKKSHPAPYTSLAICRCSCPLAPLRSHRRAEHAHPPHCPSHVLVHRITPATLLRRHDPRCRPALTKRHWHLPPRPTRISTGTGTTSTTPPPRQPLVEERLQGRQKVQEQTNVRRQYHSPVDPRARGPAALWARVRL
jgi:hypothetical protein